MNWLRRHWHWLVGPVAAGLASLAGWLVQTGDFLIMPGEAVNTSPLVQVASAPPKPRGGSLLLVTIYSSPANFDEWLIGHVYPHAHLEPSRTQLPPNTSYERFRHIEEAMMADSQTAAKVAALRQMGYTVTEHGQGVVVTGVQRDSAAEAAGIGRGDLIVAIDGQPITTAGELFVRLDAAKPGQAIRLTLKPNNSDAERDLDATLRARSNEASQAFLGITPSTYRPSYDFPIQVSIDAKGIIGPSAGLVLALSIIQAVSPTDITHGHNVAATGTIDMNGRVGAVGGVTDKVIAAESHAEYLLVPKADAEAAKKTATTLKIVEADTLLQAMDFLKTLA